LQEEEILPSSAEVLRSELKCSVVKFDD
jgi:hypothetical protein